MIDAADLARRTAPPSGRGSCRATPGTLPCSRACDGRTDSAAKALLHSCIRHRHEAQVLPFTDALQRGGARRCPAALTSSGRDGDGACVAIRSTDPDFARIPEARRINPLAWRRPEAQGCITSLMLAVVVPAVTLTGLAAPSESWSLYQPVRWPAVGS